MPLDVYKRQAEPLALASITGSELVGRTLAELGWQAEPALRDGDEGYSGQIGAILVDACGLGTLSLIHISPPPT